MDVELIDAGVSRRTFYGGLLRYNYYIAADSGDDEDVGDWDGILRILMIV